MSALLLHSLVLVCGLVAYVVLTVTGHDGNTVLAATAAYGGGGLVQAKAGGAP